MKTYRIYRRPGGSSWWPWGDRPGGTAADALHFRLADHGEGVPAEGTHFLVRDLDTDQIFRFDVFPSPMVHVVPVDA